MSSPAPNLQYKSRHGERSAKPSAAQSHPRYSSHSGESVRSGGVSKHLNNNLHHPSDTQTTPRPQRELPIHVDSNHYRSVNAQVQPNLQRADPMHMDAGLRRPMNARAPLHPQREAPRYSDPVPQHPSNFQGQPAQQEHPNEGGRRVRPIPPQLVVPPANSRSLPQEFNVPRRSVTESQRRERPPPVIIADTSDSEDTKGQQRSPSPLRFKERRGSPSKDGRNPGKQLYYVRPPRPSLFKSSKMDGKSTEKSKTDSGKKTLGRIRVREYGITQQGTNNSKAWKPSSKVFGYSWAPGDNFVTRKKRENSKIQTLEGSLTYSECPFPDIHVKVLHNEFPNSLKDSRAHGT
ncbi:uncharacterized protein EAF01_011461 [Botrytis porri]|uniref:uncharacterized protein n=1 Tax=Botrytis porri TaxID=87229 RepID=UPI0018FF21AC|nr:uncharacterized protein EAF01_011461 [Botrytis porri]KAF7885397.1 hypothetical protein EAF01_011461 [Botrytis porri]